MYEFRFSLHANIGLVTVRFPNRPARKTRFSCIDQYHDYHWHPMGLLKLSAHHTASFSGQLTGGTSICLPFQDYSTGCMVMAHSSQCHKLQSKKIYETRKCRKVMRRLMSTGEQLINQVYNEGLQPRLISKLALLILYSCLVCLIGTYIMC